MTTTVKEIACFRVGQLTCLSSAFVSLRYSMRAMVYFLFLLKTALAGRFLYSTPFGKKVNHVYPEFNNEMQRPGVA